MEALASMLGTMGRLRTAHPRAHRATPSRQEGRKAGAHPPPKGVGGANVDNLIIAKSLEELESHIASATTEDLRSVDEAGTPKSEDAANRRSPPVIDIIAHRTEKENVDHSAQFSCGEFDASCQAKRQREAGEVWHIWNPIPLEDTLQTHFGQFRRPLLDLIR